MNECMEKKIIKSEVTWWNCPREAVGVTVTLHTINGSNDGKCKNAKGCVPCEDIHYFAISQKQNPATTLTSQICTWLHPFFSLLGAETITSTKHLGSPPTSPLNWGRKAKTLMLVPLHNHIFNCSVRGFLSAACPGGSRVPPLDNLTHNCQNFLSFLVLPDHPAATHEEDRLYHTAGFVCTQIRGEKRFLSSPCHAV